MKLIIIRHGQTNWNIDRRYQGHSDNELNNNGILQAKKTRNFLSDLKFDVIISSPLKRTKKTAEIINEYHNHTILIDKNFIERNFGKLEGEKYSESNLKEISIRNEYHLNGIENLKDFRSRVEKSLKKLFNKYKNKTVLLITHGGIAFMMISILEKKSFEEILKNYTKKPATITTIEFNEDENHNLIEFAKDDHLID